MGREAGDRRGAPPGRGARSCARLRHPLAPRRPPRRLPGPSTASRRRRRRRPEVLKDSSPAGGAGGALRDAGRCRRLARWWCRRSFPRCCRTDPPPALPAAPPALPEPQHPRAAAALLRSARAGGRAGGQGGAEGAALNTPPPPKPPPSFLPSPLPFPAAAARVAPPRLKAYLAGALPLFSLSAFRSLSLPPPHPPTPPRRPPARLPEHPRC